MVGRYMELVNGLYKSTNMNGFHVVRVLVMKQL
jgi:hypothetical protein